MAVDSRGKSGIEAPSGCELNAGVQELDVTLKSGEWSRLQHAESDVSGDDEACAEAQTSQESRTLQGCFVSGQPAPLWAAAAVFSAAELNAS
jgi:hypothetical protein